MMLKERGNCTIIIIAIILCFYLCVNSKVTSLIVGTTSTLNKGLAMIETLNTKLYFQIIFLFWTSSFLIRFSLTEAERTVKRHAWPDMSSNA